MAMIGEKASQSSPERRTSSIGRGLKIKGNLKGEGNLIVFGQIDGEVELAGSCSLQEMGSVTGNISAESVVIGGRLVGNAKAKYTVELLPTAAVTGDITVPRITISDGAKLSGKMNVGVPT